MGAALILKEFRNQGGSCGADRKFKHDAEYSGGI